MAKVFLRLMALALLLCVPVSNVNAETFTVFGPGMYVSTTGKAIEESSSFSSPLVGQDFTLKIQNGDSFGANKASSVTIALNGVQVVGPSELNPQVSFLEKPVSIESLNELTVTMGGKPDCFIHLSIVSERDITSPAPTVSFVADPAEIGYEETSTLSWHVTDADTVTIEPDIGSVGLDGRVGVSPETTTTYTLTATGSGGTASASATVTFILPVPTVSLTANPVAITAGESTTLSWTSTNANSCELDNGIGTVGVEGSVVVSPVQSTTYIITATGPWGTGSDSALVAVSAPQSPVSIRLDDVDGIPLDGSTINTPYVTISGIVGSSADPELGVTVNGVLAVISEGRFIANHVPLVAEWNILTAKATDGAGNTNQVSVNVYCNPSSEYVLITPSLTEGIAPLGITFGSDMFLTNPVATSSLTCNGPTSPVVTQSSLTEYTSTFAQDGLYLCTYTVQDSVGNIFQDKVDINVLSKEAIDGLLRAKWNGMREALAGGDIEGSLLLFIEGSREKYRNSFTVLQDLLPALASGMEDIELVYVKDKISKYRISREQEYEGQLVTVTYSIYFSKNVDGMWQIQQF